MRTSHSEGCAAETHLRMTSTSMEESIEEIVLLPLVDHHQNHVTAHNRRSSHISDNNQRDTSVRRKKRLKLFILCVAFPSFLFPIVGLLALQLSYALPTVRPRSSASHLFSEERARDHYPNLTQHGSRVIHTRGDFLTRQFLISQLNRIGSTAKMPLRFELDLQNFTIPQIGELQNIAVRLSHPAGKSQNVSSLLLAAHYDTVEFSPGGSDDGSGVVILLEVLSNLVNDRTLTFSDVHLIVLFTSGEEIGSKGAEAFVARHTWCVDVRRFITIDAIGGSGNAMLFRVKPSQLVVDYARVPRPHANVIADKILSFLGAENDYTIFYSNGTRFGYDIGFYLDGYSYHTSTDHSSSIKQGSLQQTGENVLALSRNILLGRVDLQQPESITGDDHLIYFDVLGRYLIVYKMSTSIIIQWSLVALILTIGTFLVCVDDIWHRRTTSPCTDSDCVYFYFKHAFVIRIGSIIIHFICYLLSLVAGLLLTIVVAYIISTIRPFAWFGSSLLALSLFGLPCLIGIVVAESLWVRCHRIYLSKCSHQVEAINYQKLSKRGFDFERHLGLLLVYGLFMIESNRINYRSHYIILVWSIFICPIYLFLMLIEFSLRWSRLYVLQRYFWLPVPFIASLIPFIHSLEITSHLLRLTIPIIARGSTRKYVPRDVIIGIIIAIPVAICLLIFIPSMRRAMNFGRALFCLSIAFIVVLVVVYVRQPFTNNHPRPVIVKHVSKSMYTISSLPTLPLLVPLSSRSASITVKTYDGLVLSPLLDYFAIKSGHSLTNRQCRSSTRCTFDDTFNRTIAIQEVEIISNMDRTCCTVIFRHVPSYQIHVSSSLVSYVVHNQSVTPRSRTAIDVQSLSSSFYLDVKIQRCDLIDSPFLMLLTRTMPHVVTNGGETCQAITDTATLLFVRQ